LNWDYATGKLPHFHNKIQESGIPKSEFISALITPELRATVRGESAKKKP